MVAALDRAHQEALAGMIEREDNPRRLFTLKWHHHLLRAKNEPPEIPEANLITFKDGHLDYQREGQPHYLMLPLSEDTFWFEEIDFFRLWFETDADDRVIGVIGLYEDGRTDENPRNR